MALSLEQLDCIRRDAATRIEDVVALAQRICAVSSPTGAERQRAEFVASLWRERGYDPEIDAVSNVYVRRGKKSNKPALMLLAHIDTVFPASTPIVIRREGDLLYGPGIGDNSASVAAMLTTVDMLDAYGWETDADLLAVANVGEEGLGDLLGARTAVQRYQDQLGAVLVVDGGLGCIVNAGVGSTRLKVTVTGPGGHSFGSFGTPSAIHGLGNIIAGLASMKVPAEPKTTFNVGMIEGGTSINTIASSASALVDLRSVDEHVLEQLTEQAQTIITHQAGIGLQTTIEVLGKRPAGRRSEQDPLIQLALQAIRWIGLEPRFVASSTDANIPISLNIPSVCIGITQGVHAHTLDEYLHISPIGDGLAQLVRLSLEASALI
jgi:acetylornithine deacetylase/succinyl-diaminopimelate desuccinylase-like protein